MTRIVEGIGRNKYTSAVVKDEDITFLLLG